MYLFFFLLCYQNFCNYLNFTLYLKSVVFRSLFLTNSSDRNVINLTPPDFKPTVKIFSKGQAVFWSIPKSCTTELISLELRYGTRIAFTTDGRRSIKNCVQKLAAVRNASVLYNSLERSLVSCHEAILFFKSACQVCQLKLHIYISETSKHFLEILLKNNPKDGQLVWSTWAKRAQRKAELCCTLPSSKSGMFQENMFIWKGAPAHLNLDFCVISACN